MSRQRRSPRELLTEFIAGVEAEKGDQELHQLLIAHGRTLANELGTSSEWLTALCKTPAEARTMKVRNLLRAAQKRRAAEHRRVMGDVARTAAERLSVLARFHAEHVELDARIVLGELIVERSIKFVEFVADGEEPVAVTRSKLRETKEALKLSAPSCYLDRRGLHFRWKDGRGGLSLWPQDIRREERARVLYVPIARTVSALEPLPATIRARVYWSPALLGDVLTELGVI